MLPIARTALLVTTLAGASFVGFASFQEARDSITAEEIRAHLFLLSGDRLEGRAPGTRGADIAADYIAARFIGLGLQPVDGSYFQDVPITGITTDETTLSLALETDAVRLPASHPSDAVIWPGAARSAVRVDGELMFVGYGIDAAEWGWDDYKGRDLTGKVLLFLVGEPPGPPDEPDLFEGRALTYYGRWSYKVEEARRRGATGALIVHRPETAGYGWNVVVSSWTGERLMLADDRADGAPVLLQGWLTSDFVRAALQEAGLDFDELMVRAARRDFRPLSTGITVRSRMNSRSRAIQARNVVGYIPGRTEELVVFTSHYDHLGIGPAVDGDSIYNGAYDNASGVSVLLELADAFSRLEPTRRGLLFVATTGEEAGLLGSRHYVDHPLFPLARTVAAINIDGANLWGETLDVIAPGAELSTLGETLGSRAGEQRMVLRPDPAPENGAFFRSDQFPFAQAGVPALQLQHGTVFRDRPPGWGDALMARWLRDHYHQPSDEFDVHADLSGAVQQARLVFSVGYDVANAESRPAWHQGVPFGTTGPSARP